ILPQREMILSLTAVAAHQEAVSILPTAITRQDQLTNRDARGEALLLEVDLAEAIKRIQISDAQTFPIKYRPLFVGTVFQKITLIEADCGFILCDCCCQLMLCFQLSPRLDASFKLLHIKPNFQISWEIVCPIFKYNHG